MTGPRLLLHLEGLVLLVAAVALYWALEGSWVMFAALVLVPDVSLFAYLGGARVGASAYNVAHTTALPLLAVVAAVLLPSRPIGLVALIWLVHIGVDRVLGFGLKYPDARKRTHFSRL